MKYLYCTALALLVCYSGMTQNSSINHIQIAGGLSTHGSGDLKGCAVSASFTHYFKKKMCFQVSVSNTIHDGSDPLYFTGSGGEQVDGSIRFTVAGLQLSGNLGVAIVRSDDHELLLSAGPLLRYQSSTVPDYYEIAYPAATGLPYPVVIFKHSGPQRTYSAGGNVKIQYNYTLNKKFSIGILSGFQADSNGDNIFQTLLSAGMRF